MSYDEDVFELNVKKKDKKKKKTDDLIFELTSVSEDPLQPSSSIVTRLANQKEEKHKKKKAKLAPQHDDDDVDSNENTENVEWLDSILEYGSKGGKRKGKKYQSKDYLGVEFDEDGNVTHKKKKGKKKNKKGLTDYHKEFETEASMLRSLYVDQSKFTDSLQKKYDAMNGTKSSARGIGKFMNDLIMSITSARSTQLSIVAKTMDLKKTIADLSFKEKKEFGDPDASTNDNAMYASSFMKELLTTGRSNVVGSSEPIVDDNEVMNSDDLIDGIDSEYDDDSGHDFIDFENMNVKVYVIVDDSGAYRFEARDEDGNVVPGYPLPNKSKMSFNRSTMMATDNYGRKYPLEVSDTEIDD